MKLQFRLGSEVDLTEEEILQVLNGDSEPIRKALKEGKVSHEGVDSYIPGPWIEDNNALPNHIRDKYRDDVTIDL
jgi:hypothetical protein